ncbi:MAG: M1 family metallopeptidase [Bacteroidota bacterium]|nr:M1 family metallopeptidase [Bacteroidota bacterium]MDP4212343.1 M1 family metallopeptidase [Bacteroidota bacterium]MDP4249685.1 M1 family metallopeptidase [Bacteroidota bacterium]
MRLIFLPVLSGLFFIPFRTSGQPQVRVFTHADTLRGSITPQRAWWDVSFYDLHVKINLEDSAISGYNLITYKVLKSESAMQIDLRMPLEMDSIVQDGKRLQFVRDGNAFFVQLVRRQKRNAHETVAVYYHGKPEISKNPPWSGGFIWKRDSLGNPFISTACQTVGASIWWPCKDIESDEPDSQRIAITVPDQLMDVSNGRLRSTVNNGDGTTTYEWFVNNPINNYDVSINAGQYAHYTETYQGEQGALSLDFWPLAYNLDKAKKQFTQVRSMLQCFEHWFGPYPWYRDGYKLIEAPYLGMEHQSAVTYGNRYENGYLGRDLSKTGWGLKFDFIIVHESAHEWFGNNITNKDIADMWIHESFANYSENLYVESLFGKSAGATYVEGTRNVKNDRPVIGQYGVHDEGSGDMYNKGGNMLHTIRQIIGDDEKWRSVLRGLNARFWHQTVSSRQIWRYMSEASGVDLSKVFEQYLTTTEIPVLEYRLDHQFLYYRWTHVVKGFNMPVKVMLFPENYSLIRPADSWRKIAAGVADLSDLRVDDNFYILVKRVQK